jgi:hypothetical protein
MIETFYGRELQLNDLVPEGVVRMHPKTWEAIKPFYSSRSAVTVSIIPKEELE